MFLRRSNLKTPDSRDVPSSFAVYKQFMLALPPVPEATTDVTRDAVRATRFQPAKDRKAAVPAHFDTILAAKDEDMDFRVPVNMAIEGEFLSLRNILSS